MPVQSLIDTLEQLIDLHQELTSLAQQKTDVIKTEDMKQLGSILVQEKKLVDEIEKLERVRQNDVHTFLEEKGIANGAGLLSEYIQYASTEEQAVLTNLGAKLREVIASLKEQNELNQQLIYQSLQFVNLNLNLMLPEQDSYTYERPQDPENGRKQSQSLFDSKA